MGKLRGLAIQFSKFGVVGTLCFLVDYGLMVLLTEAFGWDYFISCATSYTVSVIINYILSMRFVFSGKEDMSKLEEMLIFAGLSLIGLAFNQMVMWIVVESLGVIYTLAKLLATMTVTVFNFISRKIFLE